MIVTYPVFENYKSIMIRLFSIDDGWHWSYRHEGETVRDNNLSPSCFVAKRLAKASIDERLNTEKRRAQ